jgi:hypothetical protein
MGRHQQAPKERSIQTTYSGDPEMLKNGVEVDFENGFVIRAFYVQGPRVQNYLEAISGGKERRLRPGKPGAQKLRQDLFKEALAVKGYELVKAEDVNGEPIANTVENRRELLEDPEFLADVAEVCGSIFTFQKGDDETDPALGEEAEPEASTPTVDS